MTVYSKHRSKEAAEKSAKKLREKGKKVHVARKVMTNVWYVSSN